MTTRVLVVGATGTQGHAVARHLLARGRFTVRAPSRRPQAARARALARSGAEIVEGDLASRASVRAALQGCQVVFGLASRFGSRERRDVLGLNLINAVAGSPIDHFVLSDRFGHLERYARSLQLPATYIRPALYFERLCSAFGRGHARTHAAGPFPGHERMPAIAGDDIGGLVARLFERSAEWTDRSIAAVGDCRSLESYAAAWAGHDGRVTLDTGGTASASLGMLDDEVGPAGDRPSPANDEANRDQGATARSIYPEMRDFDSWLRRHDVDLTQTLSDVTARDDGPNEIDEEPRNLCHCRRAHAPDEQDNG